ncbi:MAG: OmpA family protein [Nautiliaceae bacterium]|jgi:peptidoglycan-associated lipoprotein
MKKNLLVAGFAAFLLLSGCTKQPVLEDAKEVNTTTSTPQVQQPAEVVTQADTQTALENNESVSTANTEVEEQQIPVTQKPQPVQKEFVKEVSQIVVYFDFDKYNIRKDQWPKVEKLAKLIKENPANYTIRIEGNCDEWGTEEYNYALGLKRANSVRNALIKLGVDPKKLTVISYGELNPVCTAHAKWCWRKNRRDNFTYLP